MCVCVCVCVCGGGGGGSKSAKGGPNPLADMDRGGPNSLADLDRGVQIRGGSKSAVTPAANFMVYRGQTNFSRISGKKLLLYNS